MKALLISKTEEEREQGREMAKERLDAIEAERDKLMENADEKGKLHGEDKKRFDDLEQESKDLGVAYTASIDESKKANKSLVEDLAGKIKEIEKQLTEMTDKSRIAEIKVIINEESQKKANAILTDMTKAETKTITVNVITKNAQGELKEGESVNSTAPLVDSGSGVMVPEGPIQGMATGGDVFTRKQGAIPGAGSRDTVRAMLTPGEFVVKKEAVSKFGLDFLNKINNMMMPGGIFGAFAEGGPVGQLSAFGQQAVGRLMGAMPKFQAGGMTTGSRNIQTEVGEITKIYDEQIRVADAIGADEVSRLLKREKMMIKEFARQLEIEIEKIELTLKEALLDVKSMRDESTYIMQFEIENAKKKLEENQKNWQDWEQMGWDSFWFSEKYIQEPTTTEDIERKREDLQSDYNTIWREPIEEQEKIIAAATYKANQLLNDAASKEALAREQQAISKDEAQLAHDKDVSTVKYDTKNAVRESQQRTYEAIKEAEQERDKIINDLMTGTATAAFKTGSSMQYFAEGGKVTGAEEGAATPIVAHDGEYVMKAGAVRTFGSRFMEAVNNMRIPSLMNAFNMPHFAEGGLVGATAGAGGLFGGLSDFGTVKIDVGGTNINAITKRADLQQFIRELKRAGATTI
jgi:hypothetical protein